MIHIMTGTAYENYNSTYFDDGYHSSFAKEKDSFFAPQMMGILYPYRSIVTSLH